MRNFKFVTYMRRLRGRSRDSKPETNLRTEEMELRSSSITTISVSGNSETIFFLASSAAFTFLAGKINLAPRFANTLAVSAPIPDVAPSTKFKKKKNENRNETIRLTGKLERDDEYNKLTGDYRCGGTKIAVLCYLLGGGFRAESASSGGAEKVSSSLDHLFLRRSFSVTGDCYFTGEIQFQKKKKN